MKDRTNDVRRAAEGYGFEFITVGIEQAFDKKWWAAYSGSSDVEDISASLTSEGILFSL